MGAANGGEEAGRGGNLGQREMLSPRVRECERRRRRIREERHGY